MRKAGRAWLNHTHKIPHSVVRWAEQGKFIHYGKGEVGFIGWDQERRRYMSVWQHQSAGGPVRLAPHSDPSVPPILPGESNDVVLCSDGVTALRALADAERSRRAMPTVIALYGQRPERLLMTMPEEIRDVIARADHVGSFGTVDSRELHTAVEAIRSSRLAGSDVAQESEPHRMDRSDDDDRSPGGNAWKPK